MRSQLAQPNLIPALNEENYAQPKVLTYGTSLVTAITGWRGALKTLLMVYLCVMDMKHGHKVWSTEFIKGPVKRNGKYDIVQSNPLTFDSIITMDEDLRGGIIAIDEINMWFSAMRAMTNQNQIATKFMQIIRKRQVSVYHTSQRFQSIDPFIRWQTDLHVACRDIFHTPAGKALGVGRGEWLQYVVVDKSGYLTGTPYEISGDYSSGVLDAKTIWHYYDTEASVNIWEAMAKVEFKRPTKIVDLTGGEEEPPEEEIDRLGPGYIAEGAVLKEMMDRTEI